MGMFDSLYVHDPLVLAQVVCAHGHAATAETQFQTKDLECLLDGLYIHDGHLHRVSSRWMADEDLPPEPPPPGDRLEYTGQVQFYGNCPACPETYWIRSLEDPQPWGPQRHRPWTEYVALFVRGKLVHLEARELETQEASAEKMRVVGWIQADKQGTPL
jgi:hypothetical protein